MIGGLLSDLHLETTDKVPVLGDLPLLGALFRRTSRDNGKTDLVILHTPTILDIQGAVDFKLVPVHHAYSILLQARAATALRVSAAALKHSACEQSLNLRRNAKMTPILIGALPFVVTFT